MWRCVFAILQLLHSLAHVQTDARVYQWPSGSLCTAMTESYTCSYLWTSSVKRFSHCCRFIPQQVAPNGNAWDGKHSKKADHLQLPSASQYLVEFFKRCTLSYGVGLHGSIDMVYLYAVGLFQRYLKRKAA